MFCVKGMRTDCLGIGTSRHNDWEIVAAIVAVSAVRWLYKKRMHTKYIFERSKEKRHRACDMMSIRNAEEGWSRLTRWQYYGSR